MALSLQERIEIFLLHERDNWSHRNVAHEFNRRHPERNPVSHSAAVKLFNNFKESGSVADTPCSGRPSTSEEVRETVMAKLSARPKKSLKRTSLQLGTPKSTIHDTMKKGNVHPYKLQLLQHLTEYDLNQRLEMFEWFLDSVK
jgi:transposase